MEFLASGIDIMEKVVIAIGAIIIVLGIMNLIEASSSQDPNAKAAGGKQAMAGAGIILVAVTLIPKLAELFSTGTAA